MANVNIVQKPGQEPQPIEIIETAIVDLAAGMKRLSATRLKRETVVTLLHDHSKVPKRDIRTIIENLGQLEEIFLKPKHAKKP